MDLLKLKARRTVVITEVSNQRHLLNLSDIIDHLIRVAAKETDAHASDLFISIESLKQELAKGFSGTRFLGFRQYGVDHDEFIAQTNKRDYRKIYRIDVKIDNKIDNEYSSLKYVKVTLGRVDL